ncbi:MAG: hypothetical protein IH942_05595 [Acidobacteria bacterium]|nr:hypothetical protein [Acidobacteriota bacterium]
MTIVGTNHDAVIGGVDTHADVHVTAAVNHVEGVYGIEACPTTQNGYRQLMSWLLSHGFRNRRRGEQDRTKLVAVPQFVEPVEQHFDLSPSRLTNAGLDRSSTRSPDRRHHR